MPKIYPALAAHNSAPRSFFVNICGNARCEPVAATLRNQALGAQLALRPPLLALGRKLNAGLRAATQASSQDEIIAPLHEISAFGRFASICCQRLITGRIGLPPGAALRSQLVAEQHAHTDEESHANNRRRGDCGKILRHRGSPPPVSGRAQWRAPHGARQAAERRLPGTVPQRITTLTTAGACVCCPKCWA
jgi:hypothetical protein